MSDFPGEVVENGDMSAVMENLTQKSAKQQQQQVCEGYSRVGSLAVVQPPRVGSRFFTNLIGRPGA